MIGLLNSKVNLWYKLIKIRDQAMRPTPHHPIKINSANFLSLIIFRK